MAAPRSLPLPHSQITDAESELDAQTIFVYVILAAAAVLGAVVFVLVRKHRAERKMETRAVSLRAIAVPGTWPAKAPGPVLDASPPPYSTVQTEVKRTPSSERVRLDIL